jgi:hypothetical protein
MNVDFGAAINNDCIRGTRERFVDHPVGTPILLRIASDFVTYSCFALTFQNIKRRNANVLCDRKNLVVPVD